MGCCHRKTRSEAHRRKFLRIALMATQSLLGKVRKYIYGMLSLENAKTTLLIDTGINYNYSYNYSQSLRGVSLEYSPDGRTIAALIPIDCMLDDDAEMECLMVCLWDTSTGELKASGLDGTGGVEYSLDSGTIALKSANMNSMTLRDVVTGERKTTLEHKATPTDNFIRFSA